MQIDFAAIERDHPNYARHYGASRDACFLQGSAELLPVADLYFDTVHMRGCLDHFTAPHVALLEAYRVLKFGGKLVVGLTLEGAFQKDDLDWKPAARHPVSTGIYKSGVRALKNYPKVFGAVSRTKARLMGHHDHHIFHPTYESLTSLVTTAGFRVEQEVWQKAYHNVLYLAASKPHPEDRTSVGSGKPPSAI
jgi:ubiquinone/menaquinone biosynthesis C-methylase UbiE